MPRAHDRRRQSVSDHDPLRNLLDFESVHDTANKSGNPIRMALEGILGLLGLGGIRDFLQSVIAGTLDVVSVWDNVAESLLKPLGKFAELIDGVLPDIQAPKIITDIADMIIDAGSELPIIGPGIGLLGDVWNAIFGVRAVGNNAQDTGDVALSEVALVKAALEGVITGGQVFVEKFDGADSTTLPGYTQVSFGGSGGTYGRKGGYGHWYPGGGLDQTILSIHTTDVLNTSTQRCAIKLKKVVGTSDRSIWLVTRTNLAGTELCFAQLLNSTTQYGVLMGGVLTVMGSVGTGSDDNGELWELEVGQPGVAPGTNDWLWVVKRNGFPVITTVNVPAGGAATTLLDSSHRGRGFGASCDGVFGLQSIPSDIEVITWADI
ncbi:DUF7257 domain-containing protein [Mycolicibacterium sp. XJ1819]